MQIITLTQDIPLGNVPDYLFSKERGHFYQNFLCCIWLSRNGLGGFKAGSVAVAGWPPADYEAVAFQVPADAQGQPGETLEISGDDMIITKDLSSSPIVITEGETKAMALSFNTQSMIGFEAAGADYIFYPMAPQQTYSEQ